MKIFVVNLVRRKQIYTLIGLLLIFVVLTLSVTVSVTVGSVGTSTGSFLLQAAKSYPDLQD